MLTNQVFKFDFAVMLLLNLFVLLLQVFLVSVIFIKVKQILELLVRHLLTLAKILLFFSQLAIFSLHFYLIIIS